MRVSRRAVTKGGLGFVALSAAATVTGCGGHSRADPPPRKAPPSRSLDAPSGPRATVRPVMASPTTPRRCRPRSTLSPSPEAARCCSTPGRRAMCAVSSSLDSGSYLVGNGGQARLLKRRYQRLVADRSGLPGGRDRQRLAGLCGTRPQQCGLRQHRTSSMLVDRCEPTGDTATLAIGVDVAPGSAEVAITHCAFSDFRTCVRINGARSGVEISDGRFRNWTDRGVTIRGTDNGDLRHPDPAQRDRAEPARGTQPTGDRVQQWGHHLLLRRPRRRQPRHRWASRRQRPAVLAARTSTHSTAVTASRCVTMSSSEVARSAPPSPRGPQWGCQRQHQPTERHGRDRDRIRDVPRRQQHRPRGQHLRRQRPELWRVRLGRVGVQRYHRLRVGPHHDPRQHAHQHHERPATLWLVCDRRVRRGRGRRQPDHGSGGEGRPPAPVRRWPAWTVRGRGGGIRVSRRRRRRLASASHCPGSTTVRRA